MAASMTTDMMVTPNAPLPDLERSNNEDEGPCSEKNMLSRIWQGAAASSLAVNIAAMSIQGSTVAIIAGVVAVLVAPVVIVLQFRLQDTDTLRLVMNEIRHDANRLKTQNDRLHTEVNRLETQVGKLKEKEEKLSAITAKQGTNVDSFVDLVKENRAITDKMKLVVRADTMQILVQAIVSSDWNSDANFSDQEIQILEVRLAHISGVEVNKTALHKAIKASDRTVESVVSFVKHMFRDDLLPEERIFRLAATQ